MATSSVYVGPIGGGANTKKDTLTTSNVDALAALSGLSSGLESTETVAKGQAEASREIAAGADTEIAAYTTAGDIAKENARLAGIAGDISVLQQQRHVASIAGQQSAAAGAGGVIEGGIYDVLTSTYRQGAIGEQLIGVQTALEQGGYEAAAAASDAEVAAAQAQKNAALAEAKSYDAQASQAAAQTSQLRSLYGDEFKQLEDLKNNPTKDMKPTTASTAAGTGGILGGSGFKTTNTQFHYNFGNLGA